MIPAGALMCESGWKRNIIVPGGGVSPDGERWIACRPGFFLPVPVLSRLFRRLFLEGLNAAYQAGRLHPPYALMLGYVIGVAGRGKSGESTMDGVLPFGGTLCPACSNL
jgi:Putative transposase